MDAIIVGIDPNGFEAAIEKHATSVEKISDTATKSALEAAGVSTARLLIVTEGAQATAIPIARDINPNITVIVYSAEKLPEFARPSVDFIVDPRLLDVDIVAEEIAKGGAERLP